MYYSGVARSTTRSRNYVRCVFIDNITHSVHLRNISINRGRCFIIHCMIQGMHSYNCCACCMVNSNSRIRGMFIQSCIREATTTAVFILVNSPALLIRSVRTLSGSDNFEGYSTSNSPRR